MSAEIHSAPERESMAMIRTLAVIDELSQHSQEAIVARVDFEDEAVYLFRVDCHVSNIDTPQAFYVQVDTDGVDETERLSHVLPMSVILDTEDTQPAFLYLDTKTLVPCSVTAHIGESQCNFDFR